MHQLSYPTGASHCNFGGLENDSRRDAMDVSEHGLAPPRMAILMEERITKNNYLGPIPCFQTNS